jgi:hypothetical protein
MNVVDAGPGAATVAHAVRRLRSILGEAALTRLQLVRLPTRGKYMPQNRLAAGLCLIELLPRNLPLLEADDF